jgi:hypothetical protein
MNSRDSWFAGKRSLLIRNLLKEFHGSYSKFLVLYDRYLASSEVSFAEIEQLVGTESRKGPLWRLKDTCHRLWRQVDFQKEINGRLLDWIMGSLFHEAMKLKENAYISQHYRPLAEKMACPPGDGERMICGMDFERLLWRTADESSRQMENLSLMFGRANYLLRLLMKEQSDNVILLRYLIENEQVVVQLWSESLRELFQDMFFGAPEHGYCAAARSYLTDHWQEQALATYVKALEINARSEEAQRYVLQLKALLPQSDPRKRIA